MSTITRCSSNPVDPAWQAILATATPMTIAANSTIFRQGDSCRHYLLIKSGRVKVFTRAENGREILLYRVGQGESCTLTTSCLLADNKYPAEGVTEIDTQAWLISKQDFNQQLHHNADFRQLVFDSYGQRLRDVISLVEQVSFGRIDIRLAKLLVQRANRQQTLVITHQQIATELGTAREVISRQLKDFEHHAWLTLQRGTITLTSLDALCQLAQSKLI